MEVVSPHLLMATGACGPVGQGLTYTDDYGGTNGEGSASDDSKGRRATQTAQRVLDANWRTSGQTVVPFRDALLVADDWPVSWLMREMA